MHTITGLIRTIREWRQRAADRCRLARLEAHALNDIGLNCAIAGDEARRPFWRPIRLTRTGETDEKR